MNLERMLKWQDALINLPDEKFNFSSWASFDLDGTVCTVCAGGLAAHVFADEGLEFATSRVEKANVVTYNTSPSSPPLFAAIAIAKFFDITPRQAQTICHDTSYSIEVRQRYGSPHIAGWCPVPREACIARIDQVITDNLWREHVAKQLIAA